MKRSTLLALTMLLSIASASAQSNKIRQNQDSVAAPIETMTDVMEGTAAEKPAVYPGGMTALMRDIATNMVYPASAIENNLQGRVVLNFVVTAEGKIGEIKVAKSLSKECDEAAINALKKVKKFKPAVHQGRKVAVKYALPVTFRFSDCQ